MKIFSILLKLNSGLGQLLQLSFDLAVLRKCKSLASLSPRLTISIGRWDTNNHLDLMAVEILRILNSAVGNH